MDHLVERLRIERERQRRTLRDLAAETKIREPFLAALERGEFHVLPAVYVRSFIKTYAAALRIPPKDVAAMLDEIFDPDADAPDRFPERRPPSKPQPKSEPTPEQKREQPQERMPVTRKQLEMRIGSSFLDVLRGFPLWVWLIAVAVLVLGITTWIWKSAGSDATDSGLTDSTANIVDVNAEEAMDRDSMVLTAEVTDTAWINITADGRNSQQTVLLPGMDMRWSAMKKFDISMSNAGGAVFYRDGEKLPAFGKKGESVRSIAVTRKDVTTSSTSWRPPAPSAAQPAPRSAPSTMKAKPQATTTSRSTRKALERPSITPAPLKPAVQPRR